MTIAQAQKGIVKPAGSLGLVKVPKGKSEYSLKEVLRYGFPQRGLPAEVNRWRWENKPHLWRGLRRVLVARIFNISHFYGSLFFTVTREDGSIFHYGLASMRVVTNAGVGFITDSFQNLVEMEDMKFHAFGTGTNAEAVGDTSLQTELTTEYAADNTRPTGTTTEGPSANIYRTVATLSPDSGGTLAITEHGVLDQASNAGGVLFDRSVFAVQNIVAGADSLQATYDLTMPAGS